MPQTIVDLFKTIQIDKQDCRERLPCLDVRNMVIQGFQQLEAVRQARQRIVLRLVSKPVREELLFYRNAGHANRHRDDFGIDRPAGSTLSFEEHHYSQ